MPINRKDVGIEALAIQILKQANQDYIKKPNTRDEVDRFLDSLWFITLCDLLKLDASNVKRLTQLAV